MAILLSSANSHRDYKMGGTFKGHFETRKSSSLNDLKTLCTSEKYEAILLHRMLIDVSAFSGLRRAAPIRPGFFFFRTARTKDEALLFLKMGVVGYSNTYISSPRLLEALRVVTHGGVWLGQKVIQRLITDTASNFRKDTHQENDVSLLATLTRAERNIAELVARGESNLGIAADLNITERTVKAHLTSIYEKQKPAID